MGASSRFDSPLLVRESFAVRSPPIDRLHPCVLGYTPAIRTSFGVSLPRCSLRGSSRRSFAGFSVCSSFLRAGSVRQRRLITAILAGNSLDRTDHHSTKEPRSTPVLTRSTHLPGVLARRPCTRDLQTTDAAYRSNEPFTSSVVHNQRCGCGGLLRGAWPRSVRPVSIIIGTDGRKNR